MQVPEFFVGESMLTPTQYESLLSYSKVRSHETTLKQVASARSGGPVKVGSYYRTVEQARTNLQKSVTTVVIGLWLGVIRREDLLRLFQVAGLGIGALEGEGAEKAAAVFQALIKELVTV